MVAINIYPQYPLEEWTRFWKSTGAGEVLWAQDVNGTTIETFRLVALGTEMVLDREGRITFRSDGPAGMKKLKAEIEEVL